MSAWQIVSLLVSGPSGVILLKWIHSLTGSAAKAKAKALDVAAKANAEAKRLEAAKEAAREKEASELRAEIRSHRVTRDAEILALAVECAKLREDSAHDREKAQSFEVQAAYDRGTLQRLAETVEARDATVARLERELADCRRIMRASDPFGGG